MLCRMLKNWKLSNENQVCAKNCSLNSYYKRNTFPSFLFLIFYNLQEHLEWFLEDIFFTTAVKKAFSFVKKIEIYFGKKILPCGFSTHSSSFMWWCLNSKMLIQIFQLGRTSWSLYRITTFLFMSVLGCNLH